MKLLILASFLSILGGFIVGEIVHSGFSIIGALISGVSFGLGVFCNIEQNKNDRAQPIKKISDNDKDEIFDLIGKLIATQVSLEYETPKKAFGAIMKNKVASGYIFGFHDAMLQKFELVNESDIKNSALAIKQGYKKIFGEPSGYALYSMAMSMERDNDFQKGRMIGGNDLIDFFENKNPPLGLNRILFLNTDF